MVGHSHWRGSLPGQDQDGAQQLGRAVGSAPPAWACGPGSEAAQDHCSGSLLMRGLSYVLSSCAGLPAWLSAWTGCKLFSVASRHQWPCFLEGWDWGLCLAVAGGL